VSVFVSTFLVVDCADAVAVAVRKEPARMDIATNLAGLRKVFI
jgi:hypothetical protein